MMIVQGGWGCTLMRHQYNHLFVNEFAGTVRCTAQDAERVERMNVMHIPMLKQNKSNNIYQAAQKHEMGT